MKIFKGSIMNKIKYLIILSIITAYAPIHTIRVKKVKTSVVQTSSVQPTVSSQGGGANPQASAEEQLRQAWLQAKPTLPPELQDFNAFAALYNKAANKPFVPAEMHETISAKFENLPDTDYRVKTVNEELAKVKIPTEATDELLAYVLQQEKLLGTAPKGHTVTTTAVDSSPNVNIVSTTTEYPTNVTVQNNSNLAVQCVMTALHTTPAQTAFFSRKYNKYITQTAISTPEIIKPGAAVTLTLDPAGVDISNNETVIAMTAVAAQVTGKKHIKEESYTSGNTQYTKENQTILVTDIITDTWMTKAQTRLIFNSPNSIQFPSDFTKGGSTTESHEGMNYYNLIAYMRACERIYEYSTEQVGFPVQYYNPNYISQLPPKELDNLYAFIIKKFNQKSIPMPVGLSALLNCGKYNFVAQALGQIALAIVLLIIPGGQEASASLFIDFASTIQTIVDQSISIGKGVSALKAKKKG